MWTYSFEVPFLPASAIDVDVRRDDAAGTVFADKFRRGTDGSPVVGIADQLCLVESDDGGTDEIRSLSCVSLCCGKPPTEKILTLGEVDKGRRGGVREAVGAAPLTIADCFVDSCSIVLAHDQPRISNGMAEKELTVTPSPLAP